MASTPDSDIAFQQMYAYLQQWVGMTAVDWELMLPFMKVMQVPKKSIIQQTGEQATTHYFIVEGLVRWFYLDRDGKEHNKAFYGKNHIAGSLSAIILDEPARFSIETIEPCTLVATPIDSMREQFDHAPSWKELFNRSCQMMLIRNERREAELLTLSAKERFLQFHRNFPSYFERIPQYQIASYLGITPVALSRYKEQWLSDAEND